MAPTPRSIAGAASGGIRKAVASVKRTFSKENVRSLFTSRSFKSGGFTTVSCLIAFAVAIVAVVAVESLPAAYTKIDISESQITSISDETQEYLANLAGDITINVIVEDGEEDEYLEVLLEKYRDASDRVTVVKKDPVLYPTFASQYTSDELSDNSLIITYGDDYRVVDGSELYTANMSTYSYEFGGESAITSAITALTSEDLPRVYLLTGHGEADLPTDAASSVESANIDTAELNLLSEGSVPDDADAVVVYAPASDLSQEEKDALASYLEAGGSFMLVTDYDDIDMPNLYDLMNSYGLEPVSGVVLEGDADYRMAGYPYYLLPEIGTHDITESIVGANSYVIFPLAHGIQEIDQYRSSLTVTPLLSTTSSAYVKTDAANAETLEQETGDIAGQTMVGAAVTEPVEGSDDEEARVVWYSTSQFLNDQLDARVGGNNTTLFVSSLAWLGDADVSTATLTSKGLGTSTLTVDAGSASVLSVFFIGIVPLFFLIVGFNIWRTRKAR